MWNLVTCDFQFDGNGIQEASHICKAGEDFRECEKVLYSLKELVTIFSPGPIPLPKSLETRGSWEKKCCEVGVVQALG